MGCDSDWGPRRPTHEELIRGAVENAHTRALALSLFDGFNMGGYLDSLNRESAVQTAEAIDALVRERIREALAEQTKES